MFSAPWCVECGDTHDPARRRAILARLDNPTPTEVYERLDGLAVHLWGAKDPVGRANTTLRRDLNAVRQANGWKDHLIGGQKRSAELWALRKMSA